jgi:hypothetical protein
MSADILPLRCGFEEPGNTTIRHDSDWRREEADEKRCPRWLEHASRRPARSAMALCVTRNGGGCGHDPCNPLYSCRIGVARLELSLSSGNRPSVQEIFRRDSVLPCDARGAAVIATACRLERLSISRCLPAAGLTAHALEPGHAPDDEAQLRRSRAPMRAGAPLPHRRSHRDEEPGHRKGFRPGHGRSEPYRVSSTRVGHDEPLHEAAEITSRHIVDLGSDNGERDVVRDERTASSVSKMLCMPVTICAEAPSPGPHGGTLGGTIFCHVLFAPKTAEVPVRLDS